MTKLSTAEVRKLALTNRNPLIRKLALTNRNPLIREAAIAELFRRKAELNELGAMVPPNVAALATTTVAVMPL